jgi:hypothetical protein
MEYYNPDSTSKLYYELHNRRGKDVTETIRKGLLLAYKHMLTN